MHRPRTALVGTSLAVTLVLGLGACDSDATKSPSAKTSTRSSQEGSGTKFVTDGSTPKDFPASVPVPAGKVTAARGGTQTGGREGWTIVTRVDQPVQPAFRSAQAALIGKGYKARGKVTRVRDQVRQRTYVGTKYQVSLTVSQVTKNASLVSTQVVSAVPS